MSTPPSNPEGAVAVQTIGKTIFYLCLKGKTLTETEYNDGWSNPIHVGFAKPKTTVAYTVSNGNRIVFCLDEGNYLQDYELNPDEGEWIPGQLDVLKAAAHPNTRIAASCDKEKRVYFQNPSTEIQEALTGDGGVWKLSSSLPASKPVVSTSLAVIALPDSVYAFYASQDGSIHQLAFKNSGWTDAVLVDTNDGNVKTSISVITPESSEKGLSVQYLNAKGECFVSKGGKSEKIGDVVKGDFHPNTNAQAYRGRSRGPIIIFNGDNYGGFYF